MEKGANTTEKSLGERQCSETGQISMSLEFALVSESAYLRHFGFINETFRSYDFCVISL